MHLRDEKASLRRTVAWTPFFLVSYLVVLLLIEATYIYEVFKNSFLAWNF